MVIRIFCILFLLFSASVVSYAGEFNASVDQKNISKLEPIKLELELSDLQARGAPDLSVLSGKFQIVSQGQSSITKIINGDETKSTVWTIGVVPTQTGALTIPSISIETNKGQFSTNPVPIQVSQTERKSEVSLNLKGSSFTAHLSEREVYKGQSVLANFKLIANQSIRNLQIGELQIKDAIVERLGEPKLENEVIGGRGQQVMLVLYRITPMIDGELVIPPLLLQGDAMLQTSHRKKAKPNLLDDDDDANDPFAKIHQMMQEMTGDSDLFDSFGATTRVSIASNPVSLKVLPAIAGMNPWLPATHIGISESLSSDQPKVGEPLTGVISTDIAGISANQLPSFEEQWHSNSEFKVYFDQPEILSQNGLSLQSTRKDRFTVIPEKSGPITLPEIKLAWWDTVNRVEKTAIVPARTIQVLPGIVPVEKNEAALQNGAIVKETAHTKIAHGSASSVWIWLTSSLAFAAFAIFIKKYFSGRNEKQGQFFAEEMSVRKVVQRNWNRDLEICTNVKEVAQFLMSYGGSVWGFRKNCPLSEILSEALKRNPEFGLNKISEIQSKIENALYTNKTIDLETTKRDLSSLIRSTKKTKESSEIKNHLPMLNPS